MLLVFGNPSPTTAQEIDEGLPGGRVPNIGGALVEEIEEALANALIVVSGAQVAEVDEALPGTKVVGVSRSATAHEVSVALPGTVVPGPRPRRLTATVRDRSTPHIVECSLSTDSDRTFELVLNDAGSGSLTVGIDDPDASCLSCGKIVALALDGEPIGSFVIEEINYDSRPRDGTSAARTVRASGRSSLAVLESAIVYPELGAGRLSPATRLMNFTSKDYEQKSPPWTAAVPIKRQGDVTGQWDGAPMDWPDPDAYWIWSRLQSGGSPPQPVGRSYFRRPFVLGQKTPVTIFVTADDGFELYLDGTLVAQETKAFMWAETRTFDVLLDAGPHLLAIVGINMVRDSVSTNVAGVICSVVERTEGGESFGQVLVRTDNTWSALDYPSRAPGMTPGRIMRVLVEEAQRRGALTGVDLLFGDDRDSMGIPWTSEMDFELQVGTSLLQVARMIGEMGVDVEMLSPLGLAMYPRDSRDYSATIGIGDQNVHELLHRDSCPSVTLVLAAFHSGESPANFQANDVYLERGDASMIALHGRLEAFASLGSAASADMAADEIDAIIGDNGRVVSTATVDLAVRNADGTTFPGIFHTWRPGVVVSLPDQSGAPSRYRVTRMAIVDDPSGGTDPVVRFEARKLDQVS